MAKSKTKPKAQKAAAMSPADLQTVKIHFLEARVLAQAAEIRGLQSALAHALPGVWESVKRYWNA